MLATLKSVTHEVMNEEPAGMRVLLRSTPRPYSKDEIWVFAFRDGEHAVSVHVESSSNLDACVGVLAGNAIGSLWTGLTSAQFQGNPLLDFSAADDDAMALRHTCINAALQFREDTAARGTG